MNSAENQLAIQTVTSLVSAPGAGPARHSCCSICRTEGLFTSYVAREVMFGSGEEFVYVQCPSCECLQIVEIPKDIGRYYGEAYYAYSKRQPSRGIRGLLTLARNKHLLGRFNQLGAWLAARYSYDALASLAPLHLRGDERILDVGAGSGELLLALRQVGFQSLLGVDPVIESDIDVGQGVTVRHCDLTEITGTWDVVMFHHSLEHIPDQSGAIGAAARLLAPGGHCIVRVPTVSSWAWRQYGTQWSQLDAPRHFWLHSRRSLRYLAEAAGFRVQRVSDDSTAFQFWASEQIVSGLPLVDPDTRTLEPSKSLFNSAGLREFARRASRLNRVGDGDQIVAWFVKL